MSIKAIVFINTTSGGNFGQKVKNEIVKRTDIFIVTLPEEPDSWKSLDDAILSNPQLKIIICGGDGTVNWVVTILKDYYGQDSDKFRPPLAVVPLGTGNDMSNMLGWGSSFTQFNLPSLSSRIDKVISQDYTTKNVDIWKVKISDESGDKEIIMLNYFSIGVDAKIAKEFQESREKSLHRYKSQLISKLMYLPASLKADNKELLKDYLTGYYVDKDGQQQEFQFKNSSKTFVCQAITKIYAGKDLWRSGNRAVDDGMFETIQTGGLFHLAADQIGFKTSHNIDNAKSVRLESKDITIFQVDGEPFSTIGDSVFTVDRVGSYPMMFK